MNVNKTIGAIVVAGCLLTASPVFASPSLDWQLIEAKTAQGLFEIGAKEYKLFSVSESQLNNAVDEFEFINVPLPDGNLATFKFIEDSVMAPELAKRYPELKTYHGYNSENPTQVGRFSLTPSGFKGMFNYQGKVVYVDPVKDQKEFYISYYYSNIIKPEGIEADRVIEILEQKKQLKNLRTTPATTTNVRELRVALSTTSTYSAQHGGTKATVLESLVTMVNRLNQIFIADLGVKLQLIADTEKTIFINSATDPFANRDGLDISTNIQVQKSLLDVNSFDFGHVLTTSGGGLAYLGMVCNQDYKSGGVSGLNTYVYGGNNSSTMDAFYVDYVAHEMGHQFGANHSYNGSDGGCTTRAPSAAWEPGSGSTIMSYIGLCGEQDLGNHASANFHAGNILEIRNAFSVTDSYGTCGTMLPQANQVPSVDAGNDYSIPQSTPFKLTGIGSDADSDPLTYAWDQLNPGAQATSGALALTKDDGSRPLFRAYAPTDNATRYFPSLEGVLTGNLPKGESYATTDRILTFNLTVRDGQGGVAMDQALITVDKNSGPFKLTTNSTQWDGGSQQQINWDVAATDQAPINCTSVDLHLAKNGQDYTETLALAVSNNGVTTITVPQIDTNNARVMVSCSNNVFFAISDQDIRITKNEVTASPEITATKTLITQEDQSITLQLFDVTVVDADSETSALTLSVLAGDYYSLNGGTVTPQPNFNGTLLVPVQVTDGTNLSNIVNVTVTVEAVNDAPVIIKQNAVIEVVVNENVNLSLSHLLVNDIDSALSELSLQLLPGENYTTSGLTVIPDTDFIGTLDVNVVVNDGEVDSLPYPLEIVVSQVIDPDTGGGSKSGGSLGFAFIPLIALFLLRRRVGGYTK